MISTRFSSSWALFLVPTLLCSCAAPPPEKTQIEETQTEKARSGLGLPGEAAGSKTTELPILGAMPSFSLTDATGAVLQPECLEGRVWIADLTATLAQAVGLHPRPSESLGVELENVPDPKTRPTVVAFVPQTSPSDKPPAAAPRAEPETLPTEDTTQHRLSGPADKLQTLSRELSKLGAQPLAEQQHAMSDLFLVDRQGRIRGSYQADNPQQRQTLVSDVQRINEEVTPLYYPEDIMAPPWLEKRRRDQLASAESLTVRHDFSFRDRRQESGIRFVHQVTEDSAKRYKTNHYDHGNGVVVADVDGDDRLDIYFVSQVGFNELWRNLGDGRFEDITESAGVGLGDRIGVAAAFADIDNDADADLFVTTVRGGNVLFLNDGQGRFEDVSETAGLAAVGHASGAVFFDFDRDGLLDLLVTNVGRYTTDEVGPGGYYVGYPVAFDGHLKAERSEPSLLYRNLGDHRFVEVSQEMGLLANGWNGDAVVLDLNEDGWLDLFLANMQGHDDYFENQAGQRFVNRSQEIFPVTPFGTMGIQILDFDNDGGMDIFLTDMHTDMVRKMKPEEEKSKLPADEMPGHSMLGTDGTHVFGNAFYHRLPDGGFEEISDQVGAENYWPWGLSRGDLNADGFEDVFITSSMSYGWRYAVNSLLLNDRGQRFHDSEMILGVEPRAGGFGTPWFEIDCSGDDRDHFHCADRDGRWQVWGALGSRSSVIWDLDDDGDLDILTNDFGAPPMVLISDLAAKHPIHYLKIRLRGTTSNRDAVGASVVVRAADRSWRKINDGKSGYLSFSRMPLYFGLDDFDSVDSIEIQWPSGHRQTVQGPIAVDRQIEVIEECA